MTSCEQPFTAAAQQPAVRVLIVEDEPISAELLRAALEYCGYECVIRPSAVEAVDSVRSDRPDAMIVDLGLEDCDSLELVSVLRSLTAIPMIAVSSSREEQLKVAALDNGADDFVEKPFSPAELAARMRAKLRQYRVDQEGERKLSPRYDADAQVGLSRMERALVALLVRNHGSTVAEDDLIAELWGKGAEASSGDLRSLVLKVRRKLAAQHQPLFIHNERGVGYYISTMDRSSPFFLAGHSGNVHQLRRPSAGQIEKSSTFLHKAGVGDGTYGTLSKAHS